MTIYNIPKLNSHVRVSESKRGIITSIDGTVSKALIDKLKKNGILKGTSQKNEFSLQFDKGDVWEFDFVSYEYQNNPRFVLCLKATENDDFFDNGYLLKFRVNLTLDSMNALKLEPFTGSLKAKAEKKYRIEKRARPFNSSHILVEETRGLWGQTDRGSHQEAFVLQYKDLKDESKNFEMFFAPRSAQRFPRASFEKWEPDKPEKQYSRGLVVNNLSGHTNVPGFEPGMTRLDMRWEDACEHLIHYLSESEQAKIDKDFLLEAGYYPFFYVEGHPFQFHCLPYRWLAPLGFVDEVKLIPMSVGLLLATGFGMPTQQEQQEQLRFEEKKKALRNIPISVNGWNGGLTFYGTKRVLIPNK